MSRLAGLLDREQERIAAAWASALARMRPSGYVYRPLEELRRLGRSYIAELIAYLDSDDPTRLREFIHREAAMRLSMGFGAADVVQGFAAFRDLTEVICAEVAADRDDRTALERHLAQATDFTVVEFVTHFQQLLERQTAAQARELEDLQRALLEQAVRDPVTDLFISRYFDEHLAVEVKRAARYGRTFSIAVLEIDDFGRYRDRYGEHAAEEALAAVAGVLKGSIREVDVKAHLGGAAFGLTMPETPLPEATTALERIRSETGSLRVREEAGGEGGGGELTLSVGLGAYPEHGATARQLLQTVLQARNRAQMLGGNLIIQAEAAGEAG